MNRTESVPQLWPTVPEDIRVSPAVVRSHLLANPQGLTITEIVDRAALVPFKGDQRADTSPYLAAVWRVLLDLEERGVVVEVNEKWYDLLQLQRSVAVKVRRDEIKA